MLRAFISSKIRINVIQYFLLHPETKIYVRELSKLLDEPLTPVRRELIRLHKVGLLRRTKVANLVYYYVNPNFVFFEELKSIILKTEKENVA